ncbi:prepilin-type N-terminal cleavage/methylation domain-containing protein [Candidatus Daviesbacteria bacterium]|nr:prepilin-type N-terminal cleavage/methylation domain-containing protein [Candidatus Daviesbacteria bacterium]
MKKSAQVQRSGFTLVELLVVIAIIAILAAVVVLIINPLELTRRGRDAARLADLANLQNAINVAVQEATGSGTSAILCAGGFNNSASSCKGSSNAGTRASDGTGWVGVNLGAQKSVSVPTLPADPTNDTTSHYTYCSDGDSWEINATLESVQQSGKTKTDGGDDDNLYEVGSNLKLVSTSGGTCTY